MPLFILRCIDTLQGPELRAAHRDAHLAHVRGGGRAKLAGPLLDDAGAVIGSFLIVQAENCESARVFSESDPFRQAGVYSRVDIHSFRLTFIAPDWADGPKPD